ncbi:uncharacterized protein PFLUO_LOCUS3787 [Penicillium psychrofluorescens]|uniref:uncharacterized protein n=1 Tax=Penicillium psychrofluorescens TaxID=3158075 RepID=UPI003CCD9239
MPDTDLAFDWGNTPSFWFSVRRKLTNESLFSTQGSKLVYENQFLEFVTQLPSNYNISGLGEHIHALRLQPGFVATNWNADIADPVDRNMYGTHPFYMETRYSQNAKSGEVQGVSHGVYLRNSHGLEAVFGDTNLTWRALGGAIELYFMDGPTPADVTAQYTSGIVGLPAMQQYWTFGFHQCHWGYSNWSAVQNNIDQYRDHNIPLETQWVDIDYMDAYADFTTDPVNFPVDEGQALIGKLHNNGQHFIPIVDAALWWPGNLTNYTSYNHGHDLGIFIKNPDGSEFVGQVWPGNAVWPDWLDPKAEGFWATEIADFHQKIPFDGIWNDMNEPSNFCTGSCGTKSPPAGPVAPGERNVNSPPYAINNVQGDLNAKTVATNATQYGGVQHYDVHNIFGYGLLRATNAGLQKAMPGKRPFIIGRSTFAGVGKYSGHWGGDNYASWQLMYWSIPQALTNALFGIPMFGPDTCAIGGNTTSEQCGRWMQLSAFFPFYRNHYGIGEQPREAWRWPDVAEWSRDTIRIRYSIIPYIYTLFHAASTTGSTVMRALQWEFPDDPSLFGADRQFLLGPAIMVIPVLNGNVSTVDGVFPGTQPWYDWYNQTAVPESSHLANTTIDAPLGHIPLYVRGGYVVPMQQPSYTLRESRRNPWGVLVALDSDGCAEGSLYIDDGESLKPSQAKDVSFLARQSSLVAKVHGDYMLDMVTPLANVTVMGVPKFSGSVRFNGAHVDSQQVSYDQSRQLLQITGLQARTSKGAWEDSWEIKW